MALLIDGVLGESALMRLAGETVYGRGEGYVQYVRGLQVRSGVAEASVQAKRVYRVRLAWGPDGIHGECTCPHHGEGNFCKHLVAVGLKVIGDQVPAVGGRSGAAGASDETHQAGVPAYLAGLDAPALRDLVLDLAAYSEPATRELQLRAALASGQAGDIAQLLTAAVTSALNPRGFIDYRRSFEVARDVEGVLDEAEKYLGLGAADAVRPALLKALTRLRTLTQRADDSAGVLGSACQRAADLYARACRDGSPDPGKLATWLLKFRTESPGWPETPLADFVSAFDDKALTSYRRGVAALDRKLQGADRYRRFGVHQMLLELADHDQDVDRAVELLAEGEHPEFVGIVGRLRAAGRMREAMAWVDRAVAAERVSLRMGAARGYWLDPATTAGWYLDDGRDDDAITLLRGVFLREPSVTSYELLARVAGELGRGDAERAWAVEAERARAGRPRDGSVLVDIALHEGDLDAAWRAADEYGAGSAWEALARASAASRPLEAARLYRPHLDDLLDRAQTSRYPEVAAVLRRMQPLYDAAGRSEEFADEVRALRSEYRRRTSLIAAFDKAGLPG